MSGELEFYLHYEEIMQRQQRTIEEEQELIKRLTIENINLKQILSETE